MIVRFTRRALNDVSGSSTISMNGARAGRLTSPLGATWTQTTRTTIFRSKRSESRTGYLLDTNVLSETRKFRADSGVVAFLSAADPMGLFLSV